MGAIAAAVGLTPSGLYRHYTGKAEILLAACLEAADVLQEAVDAALGGKTWPTRRSPRSSAPTSATPSSTPH